MSEFEVTSLHSSHERIGAITDLGRNVELHIPTSTRRQLEISTNLLAQSLLLNTWLLPSNERGNLILAQGSYERNIVSSATIPITDSSGQIIREINIVSKPSNNLDLGLKELQNLERLHLETSIRGVLPLAVLDIHSGDDQFVFVLSQLEKGIIPLEKLRIEDFWPRQQNKFLEELGEFVANMANQGVIHKDLWPKNIWYDLTQRIPFSSHFGLFDLELSEIISRTSLLMLTNTESERPSTRELMECARISAGFLEDAADLAEQLMVHLPASVVREHFAVPYLKNRIPIVCQKPQEESLEYVMRNWFTTQNSA